MGSSTNVSISIKAVLISAGVVSLAFLFKFSLPILIDEIPIIWSSILSWLQPPYLYFLINAIIIGIAASSRFHTNSDQFQPLIQTKVPAPEVDPPLDFAPVVVYSEIEAPVEVYSEIEAPVEVYRNIEAPVEVYSEIEAPVEVYQKIEAPVEVYSEIIAPIMELNPVVESKSEVVNQQDENEFVISRSTWTPPKKMNSPEEIHLPAKEKPLVSSRFSHRKPTSLEGGNKALRVAKQKRQETLESTWKAITDGRHVPLTRHLRKSDTFENNGHHVAVDSPPPPAPQNMMKSETFRDRTNYDSPSPVSGGKLRKEASPSQDELNRRVEAFINKFNQEMRLQRQESLNQYMEMVNRGAQ